MPQPNGPKSTLISPTASQSRIPPWKPCSRPTPPPACRRSTSRPPQGKFLHLLARMVGSRAHPRDRRARRLQHDLARARPAARRQARDPRGEPAPRRCRPRQLRRAPGVADRIDLRLGAALDTLPLTRRLKAGAPFDFVFIDADKTNNPAYFSWALRLTRSGSVIVVDNVVRGGAVADAKSRDPDVHGVRKFFDMLAAEPRVSATALQTVGMKGWDGLAIALVN